MPEDEAPYRALFKSTRIAMVVVDEEATITLVNPEFEKLSGYSRKDLEGQKKWTEFFVNGDPSKITEYHDFIADQAKGGGSQRIMNPNLSTVKEGRGMFLP